MSEPLSGPPAAPPPGPPSGPPPPGPPPPVGGTPPGNPWDRRDQLGFGTAFADTLKQFVLSPGQAYAATRESGDFAGPLIFAVLVGWIGAIISQMWNAMFGASMMQFLPPEIQDQWGGLMLGGTGIEFFSAVLVAPIFIVVGLFIWSAVLHLCIMVVGGLDQSRGGFEGTFRAVGFASVAQLANLVPIVGGMIATLWSLVLLVIGLSTLHRTSQGKALFAVLIPILFCCVCLVIGIFMFGASIAAFVASQSG